VTANGIETRGRGHPFWGTCVTSTTLGSRQSWAKFSEGQLVRQRAEGSDCRKANCSVVWAVVQWFSFFPPEQGLCEAFQPKLHAETENIAVDIVQLQGGYQRQYHYQLQYILASVRSSAESQKPMTCEGKSSEMKVRNIFLIITSIVLISNNNNNSINTKTWLRSEESIVCFENGLIVFNILRTAASVKYYSGRWFECFICLSRLISVLLIRVVIEVRHFLFCKAFRSAAALNSGYRTSLLEEGGSWRNYEMVDVM
jgi:hypothetical protein